MEIKNAQITDVSISMADHGVLTFNLGIEGGGWGCYYGGYCIGHGYLGCKDEEFEAVNGNGLVAMMRIMNVVGVAKWEDLKDKYVRVEIDGWGSPISKIGNIIEDKWFDIHEFFEERKNADYLLEQ